MSSKLTFAHRVLLLRREMELSQSAFADKLHVGRSWLSQVEAGRVPSDMFKDVFERIEKEWKNRDQHTSGARGKLKSAREAKGLTQAQLAKAVGYSLGVYQDIEDGRSQMGEKMAVKIAKALGIEVAELMSGSDHAPVRNGVNGTFGATPEIALPPGMTAKYVPMLAMAECGPMMAWDDGAYAGEGFLVIDSKDPKAFAVKLSGDSMVPKYDAGDVAIVYPSFQPRNGDVVIARLDDDHGADVMFKLYQASADKITLSSYNPVYQPMVWARAAFAWIYPVAQVTKHLR